MSGLTVSHRNRLRRDLIAFQWTLLILAVCQTGTGRALAQEPADAQREMFEMFGQQSEQFMPGMFSELSPAQMSELEKVPVTKREEADFGSRVLKNYEASIRSLKQSKRTNSMTDFRSSVQWIANCPTCGVMPPSFTQGIITTPLEDGPACSTCLS